MGEINQAGTRIDRRDMSKSLIPDLFEMSEKQEAVFTQAVVAAHGEVSVYVHPFCNLFNTSESVYLKDLTHATEVNKSATQALKNNRPVLIMEEYTNTSKLEAMLSNQDVKAQAVKINTGIDDASPYFEGHQPSGGLSSKEQILQDWQKVTDRLKKLGVKRLLVGGQFLWADSRGGNRAGTGSGCVGATIKRFTQAGFEVKISDTSPDSREEILASDSEEFKKYL